MLVSLRIRRLGVRVPPSAPITEAQARGPAPTTSGAFVVSPDGRSVPSDVPQARSALIVLALLAVVVLAAEPHVRGFRHLALGLINKALGSPSVPIPLVPWVNALGLCYPGLCPQAVPSSSVHPGGTPTSATTRLPPALFGRPDPMTAPRWSPVQTRRSACCRWKGPRRYGGDRPGNR